MNTILFDLDGTLAPFQQDEFINAYFGLLVKKLTPMGYHGDQLIQALWKGVSAMIKNDGSYTNRQVFWKVFTQELGAQALALESILDSFYTQEFDAVRSVLRGNPDRSGMLRALREKGYQLVLATNPIFPAAALETRLRWVGLASSDFQYVTDYENSRHSKPNPDYYRDILTAVDRQGGDCLMIGNNPVDDMSAGEVGMALFLVTDCIENPDHLPVNQFPHGSFAELGMMLERLPAC